MAELHRRHGGEPSSSVQVITTASIPTNNIMILPRVYHNPWNNHNIARESQAQEIHHDLAFCILAWWRTEGEHIMRNLPVIMRFIEKYILASLISHF